VLLYYIILIDCHIIQKFNIFSSGQIYENVLKFKELRQQLDKIQQRYKTNDDYDALK
jgi:hypothetical protein